MTEDTTPAVGGGAAGRHDLPRPPERDAVTTPAGPSRWPGTVPEDVRGDAPNPAWGTGAVTEGLRADVPGPHHATQAAAPEPAAVTEDDHVGAPGTAWGPGGDAPDPHYDTLASALEPGAVAEDVRVEAPTPARGPGADVPGPHHDAFASTPRAGSVAEGVRAEASAPAPATGSTRTSARTPATGTRTSAPPPATGTRTSAPTPTTRTRTSAPAPAPAPGAASRIEGLLLGLAAGDAAGWPAARHRAARMPEWTRRLTRELDTFAEQNATTTLPVPIALNQPPEPLRLGPSDDAEWAAFTAEAVLSAAGGLFRGLSPSHRLRAAVDLAWNSLAGQIAAAADRAPEVESAVLPLRARISVRAGLGNLATGLRPPATGHDNPHYFDDAACVRATVLAVVHPGDPHAAAELAEFDARYTQDGDGVHGARAMAAAVAAALGGAPVDDAVDAALAQLPSATEIGRNAQHAVKTARDAADAFELVPILEHQIVDHVYSYGIAAAETVPVALALAVASRGRVAGGVPAAACLSRVADSAPALAGALTGALGGGDSVPATWRDACRTLAGCALPRLAGTDLVLLAQRLAQLSHPRPHPDPHARADRAQLRAP